MGVKIRSFYSAVTSAGNAQNTKPVQNCTGFIICTVSRGCAPLNRICCFLIL